MKFRTKVLVSASLLLSLLVAIGLILFFMTQELNTALQQHNIVSEIVQGVFQLNILEGDYLLHQEERARVQWHLKHDSLSEQLGRYEFRDPGDQTILEELSKNHEEIRVVFDRLIATYENDDSNGGESGLREILTAQLSVKSTSMVSDASLLDDATTERLMAALQTSSSFVLIFEITIAGGVVAVTFMTVTSFDRMTEELRDSQEQLIRKERLAVLGELAGGVSHELRNPLGAIKNAAYFLTMAVEEPEPEVKETLEILDREVNTAERIISDILDFARVRPPTLRRVDVNEIVQESISNVAVPETVGVVTQLDDAVPKVLADADQLGQVFGNIILNAIQAMPRGGQLTARTETPSPEWVVVSLADTGVGISDENLLKLFQPLFTTKAKGIGLGLATSKTLMEGHGGTIEVRSEAGKGSTFTVRIPITGGE
ncbi:MAG: sensor histidine kinase [Candidatus Geothermarchaeales archaeon]